MGNKVIFAGGGGDTAYGTPDVDIYDAASDQWSTGASVPAGNAGPGAVALDGKAIFEGGVFRPASQTSVLEIYNSTTAQWSLVTLRQVHSNDAATTVDDVAVFAGGNGYVPGAIVPVPSDAVDLFNAKTGRLYSGKLSQFRSGLAAASVGDYAIIAGGFVPDGPSAIAEVYNAATGKWLMMTLSQARGDLAATTVGSKAFFAGGIPGSGRSDVVDIYDAVTGRWSTAKLSQPRCYLAATTVGAKAIFAGGIDAANGPSNVVDIYDSATGEWSTTTLSQARYWIGATSVGTKALFAGGMMYGNPVESAAVDIFSDANPSPSLDGSIRRGARGAVSVTIRNNGDATLPGPYSVNIYVTSAGVLDRRARLLGTMKIDTALFAGSSRQLTMPFSLGHLPAGSYRLVAAVSMRRATPFAGASVTI